MTATTTFEPLTKLTRDLKTAAATLSRDEARYLVDLYYTLQDNRIRLAAQVRAASTSGEPHAIFRHFGEQMEVLERHAKSALDAYSDSCEVGRWSKSVYGIGPVIAAGLIAHIDINKAPTCGHIWNFAGLNPGVKWNKGEKRPWNADLKTLCWKIGQSFMKFSNQDECFYGKLYRERKAEEVARNDAGELAEQAKMALAAKRYRDDTKAKGCYESGKLPPAHVDARARRWVVKLFLSHWHQVAFRDAFGVDPPKPYAIDILKHGHMIEPP